MSGQRTTGIIPRYIHFQSLRAHYPRRVSGWAQEQGASAKATPSPTPRACGLNEPRGQSAAIPSPTGGGLSCCKWPAPHNESQVDPRRPRGSHLGFSGRVRRDGAAPAQSGVQRTAQGPPPLRRSPGACIILGPLAGSQMAHDSFCRCSFRPVPGFPSPARGGSGPHS